MKIVMLAGNQGSGGLIGYIKGLLDSNIWDENDCEVTLICGPKLQLNFKTLGKRVKILVSEKVIERAKDVILNKKLHRDVIRLVNEENPHIVFFLNGYTRKGLENWTNVMTLHNQLYVDKKQLIRFGFNFYSLKLWLFRYAVLRSMKLADGVVFLSNFSKNQTDEMKIQYKEGKAIPFGFETENYIENLYTNKEFSNPIHLVYISALHPYKNHYQLLEACAELKNKGYNFTLTLIGQQYTKVYNMLLRFINSNEMNENIVFYKWIEHEKIKGFIDKSDIFVYASSTETTGYGLLEGMARGALIASGNQAGFPEMLKDGGLYFDPLNKNEVVSTMEKLIKMEQTERFVLRQKALEYSHEYSWDRAVLGHIRFFKEILKTKA